MMFESMKVLTGRPVLRAGGLALMLGVWVGSAVGAKAQAVATGTGKLGPAAPVTYLNKWEVYGGLNLMNFQAGQDLPTRMNLGGGELQGTYWLTPKLGVSADYRGEAGTTPVIANPYTTRPLVYMNMGMGGVQYRGPKNQHVAVNFHAFAGTAYGVFNSTTANIPIPPQYNNVGLYANKWAPIAAAGGSIDFNRSKKLALRLSPDLIVEHFGTETRFFFAISGGVVYRIGKK